MPAYVIFIGTMVQSIKSIAFHGQVSLVGALAAGAPSLDFMSMFMSQATYQTIGTGSRSDLEDQTAPSASTSCGRSSTRRFRLRTRGPPGCISQIGSCLVKSLSRTRPDAREHDTKISLNPRHS